MKNPAAMISTTDAFIIRFILATPLLQHQGAFWGQTCEDDRVMQEWQGRVLFFDIIKIQNPHPFLTIFPLYRLRPPTLKLRQGRNWELFQECSLTSFEKESTDLHSRLYLHYREYRALSGRILMTPHRNESPQA